jgi:hypothetical protein
MDWFGPGDDAISHFLADGAATSHCRAHCHCRVPITIAVPSPLFFPTAHESQVEDRTKKKPTAPAAHGTHRSGTMVDRLLERLATLDAHKYVMWEKIVHPKKIALCGNILANFIQIVLDSSAKCQ